MALTDLKKKLLQEAKDNAEKSIAIAQLQSQKNLEQNIEKLKKEKERTLQRMEASKNLQIKREKSRLMLEFHRNISMLKLDIANSALEDFANYFVNNQDLYNKWLLAVAIKYCQPHDEIILTRAVDREVLKDFPVSTVVRKGRGGIYILKGRIELNFTLEEFLRRIRNEKRREINDLLFTESAVTG
ncbi:MAG: V-type proton ATPase subunit E [candidate division WS2 bacterium]|nr:V-type proton ATPase subunit E [Candidatus Lithacetigena glycinireducens]